MRYVLGFDGGGTKTECVLLDETGNILARGCAGSSNPTKVGATASVHAIWEAASLALRSAGKSESEVAYILAGISGAAEPSLQSDLRTGLQPKFPGASIIVTSDLPLSLAATNESPAVVVIAGTGSAVLGRNLTPEFARAGGFGHVIGDPGSAYDIGRKGVALCFQKHLNNERFPLCAEILASFTWKFADLFDHALNEPTVVFPRIFPIIAKAAEKGDSSAQALLTAGAAELSQLVLVVVQRLNLQDSSFFLAKTGGVFSGSAFFSGHFDRLMREIAPKARIGPLPRPVAETAAQLARDSLLSHLRLDEMLKDEQLR